MEIFAGAFGYGRAYLRLTGPLRWNHNRLDFWHDLPNGISMSVSSSYIPTDADRFFINGFESLTEATILRPFNEVLSILGGITKDTIIGCPLCKFLGLNENQVSLNVDRQLLVTTYDIEGNPSIHAWNKDGWYTFWSEDD